MRHVLALPLFCLACSSAFAQTASVPFPGREDYGLPARLGLVVGVDNYRSGGSVVLPNLPGVKKDLENVQDLLKSIGFTVLRIGSSPEKPFVTREDISAALTDLAQQAMTEKTKTGKGAVIVVYFAGHGSSIDGQSFLMHSSFRADSYEDFIENALNIRKGIITKFSEAEPALVLLILDACRTTAPVNLPKSSNNSVKIQPGFDPRSSENIDVGLGKNHFNFLFSALPGATAGDGNTDVGGTFTSRFADAMRKKLKWVKQNPASPRKPSLRDVFEEVRTSMMAAPLRKQIPQMNDALATNFFPFPTEADFELERATYFNIINRKPDQYESFDSARKGRICELTRMLNDFSQYSYFSKAAIEEIGSVPAKKAPDCLTSDIDNEPEVDPSGTSNSKSIAPQPNPAKIKDGAKTKNHLIKLAAVVPRGMEVMNGLRLSGTMPEEDGDILPGPEGERLHPWLNGLTFGHLRRLLLTSETSYADLSSANMPDDSVLLSEAVTTTKRVDFSAEPRVGANILSDLPAGELLRKRRSDEQDGWGAFVHHKYGKGFIRLEDIRPAIVQFSATVEFPQDAYGLTNKVGFDLSSALGMLGGVAVVRAQIDFPKADGKIGFARATSVRSFVDNLFVSSYDQRKSRVFIAVRESADPNLMKNTVRVKLHGLPLDGDVRASLAGISNDETVNLIVTPGSPNDRAGVSSRDPVIKVCSDNYCRPLRKFQNDELYGSAEAISRTAPQMNTDLRGSYGVVPGSKIFAKKLMLFKF